MGLSRLSSEGPQRGQNHTGSLPAGVEAAKVQILGAVSRRLRAEERQTSRLTGNRSDDVSCETEKQRTKGPKRSPWRECSLRAGTLCSTWMGSFGHVALDPLLSDYICWYLVRIYFQHQGSPFSVHHGPNWSLYYTCYVWSRKQRILKYWHETRIPRSLKCPKVLRVSGKYSLTLIPKWKHSSIKHSRKQNIVSSSVFFFVLFPECPDNDAAIRD